VTASRSDRLRIAVVITELDAGGAERLLISLLRVFRDMPAGPDCTVYCLEGSAPLAEEIERLGVGVVHLHSRFRFDPRTIAALAHHLHRHPVDVVHAHLPRAGLVAGLVTRRLGLPFVYTEHSVRTPLTQWVARLGWRPFGVRPMTVAVSEPAAAALPSWLEPIVIQNGVDWEGLREHEAQPGASKRELGLPPDAPFLLNVAKLRAAKGQTVLLRAMRTIANALPSAHLAIAGAESDAAQRVKDLRAELGLEQNVRLLGFRRDAVELLSDADVFVLSSLREGLPIALLEAMALGVPSIVTDVGGCAEAIRHEIDGLVVAPGDPDALADAGLRLLRDPELRRRMGQAAAGRASEVFGIDGTARRYVDLYRRVLEGAEPSRRDRVEVRHGAPRRVASSEARARVP